MSGKWFRYYNEAIDDPKVQMLDGETFKAWVNLLCIASKNEGRLPPMEDIAFALRCEITVAERYIERLQNGGLIDRLNGGANGWHNAPHNWGKRQYKSDSSASRVKRYRERNKAVSETSPDTDTDTELPTAKAVGVPIDSDKLFWDNAVTYLAPFTKGSPRALIGKWCKDIGKERAARLIGDAQVNRAVDPVSYIANLAHREKRGDADKPDPFWG